MATIFLSISCNKVVTYNFTKDDQSKKLLSHYAKGKVFTLLNNDGDERKFEVVDIEQEIIQLYSSGGMGGIPSSSFYYEKRSIFLKDYRNEKIYYLNIFRYPIDYLSAQAKSYKKFPSHLILENGSIPYDMEYTGHGAFLLSFYYNEPTITLSSNGFTYNKVHIIDRDPKKVVGMGLDPDRWTNTDFGGTFNVAKYIYFDEYYGIVGLETYDGSQWRLKNE